MTSALAPHVVAALGGSILDPIAKPIASVLADIYSVVPNYGVAILFLSLGWMILISPLTLKTTRSMLAMQKLQPQLKKLQEQHKNDRQAFAAAQMELFKEHNVSPFGSCLPSILPLPIFICLFRVIDGLSHTVNGHPKPNFLSPSTQMYKDIVASGGHLNAFGLDLSKNALAHHSSVAAAIPYFVVLLVMMGTQYFQTVQMMSRNPAAAQNSQAKLMKFLPLIFGVICIRFPAGVILYYAMSNVCRIGQQFLMYRFDPKVKALVNQEVREVEAKTQEIDDAQAGKGTGPRKGTPTPPAPQSRFRTLMNNVNEQQRAAAAAKAKAGGAKPGARPNASTKPGASGKPAAGGRPAPAKKAAPGQVKKAAPAKASGTPAKAPGTPAKAAPAKSPAKPAIPTNGATTNGTNGAGDNASGATGPAATPRPGATGGSGRTGARSSRTPKKR